MPNPKNKATFTFKKAWSWPGEVEAKVKDLCRGYTLHVCCGESELGDVRIDLTKKADIRANMFNLPIARASFDTVVCDPPWELPYHKRHALLYELRDALKPGGRLIFNSMWFPRVRGLNVEPEIWVGVPHATWRNASLLVLASRSSLDYGRDVVIQQKEPGGKE